MTVKCAVRASCAIHWFVTASRAAVHSDERVTNVIGHHIVVVNFINWLIKCFIYFVSSSISLAHTTIVDALQSLHCAVFYFVGNNFQTQWLKQLSPIFRDKVHSAIVPTQHQKTLVTIGFQFGKIIIITVHLNRIWHWARYTATYRILLSATRTYRAQTLANINQEKFIRRTIEWTNQCLTSHEKKNHNFAFFALLPMMLRVCGGH